MKHFLFLVFILAASAAAADDWTLTKGGVWARQKDAITMSNTASEEKPDGSRTLRIVHTGERDWALSENNRIPVVPGDVFELQIQIQTQGSGNAGVSVITRDKDGETLQWTYANKIAQGDTPQTTLTSRFMVPPGTATIEPRLTGFAPLNVLAGRFTLKKLEHRHIAASDSKPAALCNDFLDVQVFPANGTFSVKDKRTGRTWTQLITKEQKFVTVSKKDTVKNGAAEASFSVIDTETLFEYSVAVQLEKNLPELTVKIDSHNTALNGSIAYPPPFVSQAGDRLIVPMNEGISYPVETESVRDGWFVAYGGHGLCMAFWGQVEDKTGSGMTAIIETPDDAIVYVRPDEKDGKKLLQVHTLWEPSRKEFRYPRSLRYVFHDSGGYVAVCKRYRRYAKDIGLLVPFSEKVKKNPNIDKLLGAANIWYWERDRVEIVNELKAKGIDRILWSGGGTAEQLTAMNKIDNVLTSRYDIYQDVMNPEHFDKVWVHNDWTTEAWDKDINWVSSDGNWRKGWYVDQKDKSKERIPCAVICDAKAVPYAQKRISKELETLPFTCRFIDTTVASPWFECYHPDHPMSRSDSRKHKMELLELIGDLGLVCGSETGHDASVPFCDYFEGMLSLGPYRVPDAGRNMIRIVDEVPPVIEQFQVNAALRLPLWELVYHDCVVAQWYWGDYNNKLPKVWRKRDLLNALYGTPPMYMFTRKYWDENKDRFAESYRTAAGTARLTAYAEMLDHRILSADRLVQQTVFSNGVKVTVNFGDKPFTLPDGSILNGSDWRLE